MMVAVRVFGAYFAEFSFSFCITSSMLKLAAFCRCAGTALAIYAI